MTSLNSEQRARIENSGLEIVAEGGTSESLDPVKAWKMSIDGEAKPQVVIPADEPDEYSLVDESWRILAERHNMFGDDGTFLLSIPGDPFPLARWYRVRIRGRTRMAEALANDGLPEYVTAALGGYPVVGVSSEEDGTWILVFDEDCGVSGGSPWIG